MFFTKFGITVKKYVRILELRTNKPNLKFVQSTTFVIVNNRPINDLTIFIFYTCNDHPNLHNKIGTTHFPAEFEFKTVS